MHGCFLPFRILPWLCLHNRRVFWRLSDMWPFTGHCAYSYECERWKTGCGSCPRLEEYPAIHWDTTRFLWWLKKRTYQRSKFVLIATNRWMEDQLKASPLLSHFPVYRVPNGVDTDVFRPISKESVRTSLGIPFKTKVILFLNNVAKMGTRKGGEHVLEVMQRLTARGMKDCLLFVVGEGADSWPDGSNYQTMKIGLTNSDRLLAILYSASDVLLHPALAENFPNSVLEGMACGLTTVAYNT